MRLIDADNLKIPNDAPYQASVKRVVAMQPTVEAKEVVHGKWIDGCCSNCGAYIPTDSLWDYISEKECNFCYYCGADMRERK